MYSNTPLDLVDKCDSVKSLSSVSFQKVHRAKRNIQICVFRMYRKRKRKKNEQSGRKRQSVVTYVWEA